MAQVVAHLGLPWRVHRGLPSGYLGAQVLFESPAGRGPLSVALALAPAEDREDLLRWLSPTGPADTNVHAVRIEREILLDEARPAEGVARALAAVAGDPQVAVDVEALPGRPGAAVLVAVSAPGWRRLIRGPEPVSAALGTTVYWPAPEELGGLGPDLRVAVDADGGRHLVNAVPDGLGFRVERRPRDRG